MDPKKNKRKLNAINDYFESSSNKKIKLNEDKEKIVNIDEKTIKVTEITVDNIVNDGDVDDNDNDNDNDVNNDNTTNNNDNNNCTNQTDKNNDNDNNKNDTIDEKSENKENEIMTPENKMKQIESLLSFDPSQMGSRYEIYQQFEKIAKVLFDDIVFVINKKPYRLVEFEFYLTDNLHHGDVFSHCDPLQYYTLCQWYFHKAGNNSIQGYYFLRENQKSNNDNNNNNNNNTNEEKQFVASNKNASYRVGNYKGLDFTFAKPKTCFGGILIRSIQALTPMHSAFKKKGKNAQNNDDNITNADDINSSPQKKDATIYSTGEIIEGPCRCVDHILGLTGMESIKTLVTNEKFSMNCFDKNNPFMYFDLASFYNIKPSKIDNNVSFYSSPRVGLTMAPYKGVDENKFNTLMKMKEEFLMAPYRFILSECVNSIKKKSSINYIINVIFKLLSF